MQYHHGKTIKEHRIAKKMTLAQLASKWPSKEIGVNIRYVQDVEAGNKQIVNMETLRKLASLLDIPLWKLGLSEYDPFHEKDILLHPFIDMNSLFELIENIWYIRLNMPSDITEKKIISLSNTFNNLVKDNSRLLKNSDFLVLYAQVKRLQEVVYTEQHNYEMSLKCSLDMLDLAKQSGDTVSECLAMTRIGVELLRNEDRNALDYLEQARDLSFSTASKEVAAYSYSFLARGYATFGDEKRFLQAVNTAIALADNMKGLPVVTKDYVFHAFSAVLEEKSNGLISLGRGKDALNELCEIDLEIAKEGNTYLKMWMPLDYAQSFTLMGEIETSVKWLEIFYASIKDFKSARLHSTVEKHLSLLEESGYANLSAVKSFKDKYHEEVNNNLSSK
ncbi:MAG TPA: helix-turn-helix transcriptional regulator [Ktedonobacteraceae bacterium]|nr:helix-turn-helix transcriptional regulator [Ktedonobacteraceae bacterium]